MSQVIFGPNITATCTPGTDKGSSFRIALYVAFEQTTKLTCLIALSQHSSVQSICGSKHPIKPALDSDCCGLQSLRTMLKSIFDCRAQVLTLVSTTDSADHNNICQVITIIMTIKLLQTFVHSAAHGKFIRVQQKFSWISTQVYITISTVPEVPYEFNLLAFGSQHPSQLWD